jgi:hypothetical protein
VRFISTSSKRYLSTSARPRPDVPGTLGLLRFADSGKKQYCRLNGIAHRIQGRRKTKGMLISDILSHLQRLDGAVDSDQVDGNVGSGSPPPPSAARLLADMMVRLCDRTATLSNAEWSRLLSEAARVGYEAALDDREEEFLATPTAVRGHFYRIQRERKSRSASAPSVSLAGVPDGQQQQQEVQNVDDIVEESAPKRPRFGLGEETVG